MTEKNFLSRLRKTAPVEQEFLNAISCLSSTELKAERKHQNQIIGELTKDVNFHQDSLKLFGKLKAEYIFDNSEMRKQLSEICVFHQAEIIEAQDQIRFAEKIIKKIDTPIETPDGMKIK